MADGIIRAGYQVFLPAAALTDNAFIDGTIERIARDMPVLWEVSDASRYRSDTDTTTVRFMAIQAPIPDEHGQLLDLNLGRSLFWGRGTPLPDWAQGALMVVTVDLVPVGEHQYVFTACQHGLHDQCRRTCKFCPARCGCREYGCVCRGDAGGQGGCDDNATTDGTDAAGA